MDWSDTYDIVDSLCEKYPNEEPEKLLFLDLMNMVTSLEGFEGKKENCNCLLYTSPSPRDEL